MDLGKSHPMLLDEVAADFPGLTIIVTHPSGPCQGEAIAVAQHKADVYIDLSCSCPKYFPLIMKQNAARVLGLGREHANA